MDDKELLDYAALHATTDRAEFHRDHVVRILQLAGREIPVGLPEFFSVRSTTLDPIIDEARRNLAPKVAP